MVIFACVYIWAIFDTHSEALLTAAVITAYHMASTAALAVIFSTVHFLTKYSNPNKWQVVGEVADGFWGAFGLLVVASIPSCVVADKIKRADSILTPTPILQSKMI